MFPCLEQGFLVESGFIEKWVWRSLRADIMKFTKPKLDICKGLGACPSWLFVSGFVLNLRLLLKAAAVIGADSRNAAKKSE